MKKGGNAVGATRKQPLSRASSRSIGLRLLGVKSVIAWRPGRPPNGHPDFDDSGSLERRRTPGYSGRGPLRGAAALGQM